MVGDNRIGKPVQSYNMGDEELGEFWGIGGLRTGNEVTHLSHSIDEHEDRVLAA
jgi:hypothetical protein